MRRQLSLHVQCDTTQASCARPWAVQAPGSALAARRASSAATVPAGVADSAVRLGDGPADPRSSGQQLQGWGSQRMQHGPTDQVLLYAQDVLPCSSAQTHWLALSRHPKWLVRGKQSAETIVPGMPLSQHLDTGLGSQLTGCCAV
jgi:hypothetical protein